MSQKFDIWEATPLDAEPIGPYEVRKEGETLVRTIDGARWSNALMRWVLPRSKRSPRSPKIPAAPGSVINLKGERAIRLPPKLREPKRYTRVKRSQSNRSALRNRLAEAQNWRCCYCGCVCDGEEPDWKPATIEHVIELSKGGTDDWDNLVMACYDCNDERGNKYDAYIFYEMKQANRSVK